MSKKGKKALIISVSVVLVLAILAVGGLIYYRNSPLYALQSMLDDLEKDGIDGLRPYLTEDAQKTYDSFVEVSENPIVKQILKWMDLEDGVDAFKNKSADIEWEFVDILTSSQRADVYVRFNYQGDVKGMLELRMIKEEGEWKIDGFGIPEIENFELGNVL